MEVGRRTEPIKLIILPIKFSVQSQEMQSFVKLALGNSYNIIANDLTFIGLKQRNVLSHSPLGQKPAISSGRLSLFHGSKSHEAEMEMLAGLGFFLEASEDTTLPSRFKFLAEFSSLCYGAKVTVPTWSFSHTAASSWHSLSLCPLHIPTNDGTFGPSHFGIFRPSAISSLLPDRVNSWLQRACGIRLCIPKYTK